MLCHSNQKTERHWTHCRKTSPQKPQADQVYIKYLIDSWNLYILGAHLVPIIYTIILSGSAGMMDDDIVLSGRERPEDS